MKGLLACVVPTNLCLFLMVLVHTDALSTEYYKSELNLDYSEWNGVHQLNGGFIGIGPFGHGNLPYTRQNFTGNKPSEMGTMLLKWLLGLCGFVILVVIATVVYSCRKKIKTPIVNCGRNLLEKWADMKAQDRQAILNDVDDNDEYALDTRITIDRIIYRAAPIDAPGNSGETTTEYTAVPPGSPVTDTPQPVATNESPSSEASVG